MNRERDWAYPDGRTVRQQFPGESVAFMLRRLKRASEKARLFAEYRQHGHFMSRRQRRRREARVQQ